MHTCIQDCVVSFETGMYRKPNFRPHYLALFSDHPPCHKSGIFRCEAHRALMLCSKTSLFSECINSLLDFLGDAGYPSRCFSLPRFSQSFRESCLDKLHCRDSSKDYGVSAKQRRTLFLSLPFNAQLADIGISSIFKSCFGCLVPLNLILGWTVKMNTMRRLYRLNWPLLPNAQLA
jgi:hypothetical protein